MWYVYLLVSIDHPAQHYVGLTRDLKKRLRDHNERPLNTHCEVHSVEARRLLRVRRLEAPSPAAMLKLRFHVRPKGLRDTN